MNLGAALAKSGKRVLLVDGDPQGNLTSYLGVTPGEPPFENLHTLDEIYLSKRPMNDEGIHLFITTTPTGVDLIPSDKALSGVEYYLFTRSDRERVLFRFFALIQHNYDYIFIDTPPSLNLLTINALCASNHVLIPVQPEFFSLEGIVKIRAAIDDIKVRWNPHLSIIGVLPTQISNRRKLTLEVLGTLKTELGAILFDSAIHDNVSIAESSGHALSVLDYDAQSKGSQDYLAAASELQARCIKARKQIEKERSNE
ncbi:unnamed protein product [Sphagnum tenellum]